MLGIIYVYVLTDNTSAIKLGTAQDVTLAGLEE